MPFKQDSNFFYFSDDPQIKMWMDISIGLGGVALLVVCWVMKNRATYEPNKKRTYSAGGTKRDHSITYRGVENKHGYDSEEQEPIKEQEKSKMLQPYHDADKGDEELNANNDQNTLPKKIPLAQASFS